ncbi:MAG: hypothetical protein HZT40_07330 [Candidatus Thiothrix singaporensis]|uniref:Response regulatory domain-containing protein n=1 Tax=Candidatus Thiothrix singaporensis TaxID=2799669 RepID=A0A7L6AQM4_9GAMM|nr:MAG: hypothetical protein HZT40_07330 [Candidatus Thiothrix singaporensis]
MLREPVGKQLLLIEDDEVLCRFLQESLQQEGYSVITLLEGEGIPKMMEHHSPGWSSWISCCLERMACIG